MNSHTVSFDCLVIIQNKYLLREADVIDFAQIIALDTTSATKEFAIAPILISQRWKHRIQAQ